MHAVIRGFRHKGVQCFFEAGSKSGTAHPAEVLREFLPGDMTVTEAARQLHVSLIQLSRLLNGGAAMTAEMAIRVGMLTGTTAESWLEWDLWRASQLPRPNIQLNDGIGPRRAETLAGVPLRGSAEIKDSCRVLGAKRSLADQP